jgi:flagellar protein FlaF
MHAGAQAYARTAYAVSNPRDLEAQLLLKAASGLQAVIDGKAANKKQALDALNYNLRCWKIFTTAASDPNNQQSADVKQYVLNLGVFVMSHSLKQISQNDIDPQSLKILVKINSELAAGLRGSAV